MSKLKLWKPFSLFMVLLIMSSLVVVVPAPVRANLSSITVNPYDTSIIGLLTGYRITMTTGATLNGGDNITVEFPPDTGVTGINVSSCAIRDLGVSGGIINGQQVTVTLPGAMAPIIPGEQFAITFTANCGITNPSSSGSKTVTVWTTKEPIHVTSSQYEITAVKVCTGAELQSENATIQNAIDNASAGDTITVPAGTFTENVNVNKSLTLQGASSATVTVTAASPIVSVFTVTASNVTISGFTATGTQMSSNEGYAGIKFGAGVTNCNIHDNILSSNQYGILLQEPVGNTTPGNNIFTNNTASSCGVSGIEMQNTYGNTFVNNIANSNGSQGFKLDAACSNTFTGNTANLNGTPGTGSRCGFYLVADNGGCNDNIFTNNTANSNIERDGFRLRGSNHNTFTNNTASSNGRAGIRLDFNCDNTVLTGNNFTSNKQYGIQIDDDGSTQVIDATTLTVSGNNIAGNTLFGINYDNSGGVLNAKHNYWNNASGPSHGSPVTYGDKVSANVTFQPWLVNTYTGTPPASEITISTTSPLPDGTTGVAYSRAFSATSGVAPYTWSLYSGTLPPGLSFAGSNFSGTPSSVNTTGFNFDVKVSDGIQATYKNFTLKVYEGAPVITTTSPLPNGTKNVPYGPVTLHATGGTGSYTWSPNTGTLPTGLTLAADGKISGTPTVAGTSDFNVRVISGSQSGYKDLSIIISAPSGGGQKLIGTDSDAAPAMWGSNHFILSKFTADTTGTISQIKIRCGANVHVKVAIYSDNSTVPGSLLNATDTSTACIPGWNTISITGTAVTSGTTYWLAFNSDASVVQAGNPGSGYTSYYMPATYSSFSSFPSSAGTGFTTQSNWDALIAGWSVSAPSTPTVTNSPATSISQISARLNGQVTATGDENPTVIIYWGDNDGIQNPYDWDHSENLGTKGVGPFVKDITGLTSGTLYYYRCFAANSSGNAWATSSDNFTTLALGIPTVTNSTGASNISITSARLNGAITDTGGVNPTVIIYWGDNDGRTTSSNWDNTVPLGIKEAGIFSTDITDLNSGTKYYYRCFASNSVGGNWVASSENFTTLAGGVEQKVIGTDSDAAPAMWGSNHFILSKFTADTTGTISQIKIRCGATVHVKVAIYSDSSGVPGSLLNATDTSTACIPGWNTISITGTAVTSGTPYWLAFNSDASVVQAGNPGAGYTTYYRPATYSSFSSFPSSAGTGFTTQSNWDALIAGWSSATLSAPPATPVLVTPKTTITFEWAAPSGATKYRLQVNTAADFTGTNMFNAEVSTTSQAVTLTIGTPYYWRVKAGNAGGWSGWSSTGSVTP